MKKRFFIQTGLTTMLFFLFLNLFGSPSLFFSSPIPVDYDHDWKVTPNGKIAIKGTFRTLLRLDATSYEWIISSCPPGELFNCSTKSCVKEYEACDCYYGEYI